MKPVLICGGVGTKMWPESRPERPKHFLPLIGGRSLFRLNYETLLKRFAPKEIFVQTNEIQRDLVRTEAPEIPIGNIFLEPELRNHGPATGLAAANLFKISPDEPFVLVQTDLIRLPEEKWLETIDEMGKIVERDDVIMTGAEKPKFAVMGVDYLIAGGKVPDTGSLVMFKMERFLGRDTKEGVEEFLRDGRAYLHWNHLCATPRGLLDEYKKYKPDWYEPLMRVVDGANVAEQYALMPKGPVEEVTRMALLEGYIVELPFSCIDFGTWESVAIYQETRAREQELRNKIEIEARDNFVRVSDPNKPVALIGVSDLVVVDTPQGLLVCRKDQSGRVGEVVKELEPKV